MNDEPWVKGHLFSRHGGRAVAFTPADSDFLTSEWTLSAPEILFNDSGMCITGFRALVDSGTDTSRFQMVSVDVRAGWVQPRK